MAKAGFFVPKKRSGEATRFVSRGLPTVSQVATDTARLAQSRVSSKDKKIAELQAAADRAVAEAQRIEIQEIDRRVEEERARKEKIKADRQKEIDALVAKNVDKPVLGGTQTEIKGNIATTYKFVGGRYLKHLKSDEIKAKVATGKYVSVGSGRVQEIKRVLLKVDTLRPDGHRLVNNYGWIGKRKKRNVITSRIDTYKNAKLVNSYNSKGSFRGETWTDLDTGKVIRKTRVGRKELLATLPKSKKFLTVRDTKTGKVRTIPKEGAEAQKILLEKEKAEEKFKRITETLAQQQSARFEAPAVGVVETRKILETQPGGALKQVGTDIKLVTVRDKTAQSRVKGVQEIIKAPKIRKTETEKRIRETLQKQDRVKKGLPAEVPKISTSTDVLDFSPKIIKEPEKQPNVIDRYVGLVKTGPLPSVGAQPIPVTPVLLPIEKTGPRRPEQPIDVLPKELFPFREQIGGIPTRVIDVPQRLDIVNINQKVSDINKRTEALDQKRIEIEAFIAANPDFVDQSNKLIDEYNKEAEQIRKDSSTIEKNIQEYEALPDYVKLAEIRKDQLEEVDEARKKFEAKKLELKGVDKTPHQKQELKDLRTKYYELRSEYRPRKKGTKTLKELQSDIDKEKTNVATLKATGASISAITRAEDKLEKAQSKYFKEVSIIDAQRIGEYGEGKFEIVIPKKLADLPIVPEKVKVGEFTTKVVGTVLEKPEKVLGGIAMGSALGVGIVVGGSTLTAATGAGLITTGVASGLGAIGTGALLGGTGVAVKESYDYYKEEADKVGALADLTVDWASFGFGTGKTLRFLKGKTLKQGNTKATYEGTRVIQTSGGGQPPVLLKRTGDIKLKRTDIIERFGKSEKIDITTRITPENKIIQKYKVGDKLIRTVQNTGDKIATTTISKINKKTGKKEIVGKFESKGTEKGVIEKVIEERKEGRPFEYTIETKGRKTFIRETGQKTRGLEVIKTKEGIIKGITAKAIRQEQAARVDPIKFKKESIITEYVKTPEGTTVKIYDPVLLEKGFTPAEIKFAEKGKITKSGLKVETKTPKQAGDIIYDIDASGNFVKRVATVQERLETVLPAVKSKVTTKETYSAVFTPPRKLTLTERLSSFFENIKFKFKEIKSSMTKKQRDKIYQEALSDLKKTSVYKEATSKQKLELQNKVLIEYNKKVKEIKAKDLITVEKPLVEKSVEVKVKAEPLVKTEFKLPSELLTGEFGKPKSRLRRIAKTSKKVGIGGVLASIGRPTTITKSITRPKTITEPKVIIRPTTITEPITEIIPETITKTVTPPRAPTRPATPGLLVTPRIPSTTIKVPPPLPFRFGGLPGQATNWKKQRKIKAWVITNPIADYATTFFGRKRAKSLQLSQGQAGLRKTKEAAPEFNVGKEFFKGFGIGTGVGTMTLNGGTGKKDLSKFI